MGPALEAYDATRCYPTIPRDKKQRLKRTWYQLTNGEVGMWDGYCTKTWMSIEKKRTYSKEFNARNKAKTKARMLRWRYGLSLTEHSKLISSGICHICSLPFDPPRFPCVDHEPGTGYANVGSGLVYSGKVANVRGALCTSCNLGMSFVDRSDWLTKAVEYKKRANFHPGTP